MKGQVRERDSKRSDWPKTNIKPKTSTRTASTRMMGTEWTKAMFSTKRSEKNAYCWCWVCAVTDKGIPNMCHFLPRQWPESRKVYHTENPSKCPIAHWVLWCHRCYRHRSPSRQCLYHTDSTGIGTKRERNQRERWKECLRVKKRENTTKNRERERKQVIYFSKSTSDLQ